MENQKTKYDDPVKLSFNSMTISYDDNENIWEGSLLISHKEKKIYIEGISRKLTAKERSDVITKIFNEYYFSINSIIEGKDIINYRFLDRKQFEYNNPCYNMLEEVIFVLDKNEQENKIITELRSLYTLAYSQVKIELKSILLLNSTSKEASIGYALIPIELHNCTKGDYRKLKKLLNIIKSEMINAIIYKLSYNTSEDLEKLASKLDLELVPPEQFNPDVTKIIVSMKEKTAPSGYTNIKESNITE